MFPDTVLRQVLDDIIPEDWNSHPTRMHTPKPQTRVTLWRRRNKAILSLRLVCKQWDSAVSDILSMKVDFDELCRCVNTPADALLWFMGSMARSNSFPSCRLLEHARGAVRSIHTSFNIHNDESLWRAPFAAQMAYYGEWEGLQHQLRDRPKRRLPETAAACYLPVMIFYGLEDLQDEIDNQEDINAVDEFFGSALFAAVYNQDEQVTSMLLASGADVNATGGVFHSVLQLASSEGLTDIMELLVRAGASVDDEGGEYGTALVAAVSCNHKPAFELLLANGATPHFAPEIRVAKYGRVRRPPLLVAVEHGYVGLVDRLLEIEDIDVNFKCSQSRNTPLKLALDMGHEEIAQRLASDSRIDNQYAFHIAASVGNLKIVRFLVEQKGIHPDSVDGRGDPAVISALSSSSDETATYLLAKCTFDNPNCHVFYDMSAVDVAAENGLENAVRILLEKGGDISKNSEGRCLSLQAAARHGHERVVKQLLECGADPTVPQGELPPLMEAASNGHVSIIKTLLDRPDVDVNYRGRRNMTPLLAAAFSGQYEAVRLILDSGGEINAQNEFGPTALSFAAACGFTDVVQLLLSYGAKVDMEGGTGNSGLPAAVGYEHLAIAEMLISHGANVNSIDMSRGRPLYLAVRNRHEEMVRLLLQCGDIELDLKDPDRLTPLELAEKEGYEEIVTLLLKRGAGQPNPLSKHLLEDRYPGNFISPKL